MDVELGVKFKQLKCIFNIATVYHKRGFNLMEFCGRIR